MVTFDEDGVMKGISAFDYSVHSADTGNYLYLYDEVKDNTELTHVE